MYEMNGILKDGGRVERAAALTRLGRYAEASRLLDGAVELSPCDADAHWWRGYALHELGRRQEAVRCFERVVELSPCDADAHWWRGYALQGLGRHQEAVRCFERVVELSPCDADAYYEKGNALSKLGLHKESKSCHDRACELNPDGSSSNLWKRTALERLASGEARLQSYDGVIDLNPYDADAHYHKGETLFWLGRHWEAIQCFERAADLKPYYGYVFYTKGDALNGFGLNRDAVRYLDRAISLNPNDADAHNARGIALNRLGRHWDAIRCFERVMELEPDLAWAHNAKGCALVELGLYAAAIPFLDKALELKPDFAWARNAKGYALSQLSRRDREAGRVAGGRRTHGRENPASTASHACAAGMVAQPELILLSAVRQKRFPAPSADRPVKFGHIPRPVDDSWPFPRERLIAHFERHFNVQLGRITSYIVGLGMEARKRKLRDLIVDGDEKAVGELHLVDIAEGFSMVIRDLQHDKRASDELRRLDSVWTAAGGGRNGNAAVADELRAAQNRPGPVGGPAEPAEADVVGNFALRYEVHGAAEWGELLGVLRYVRRTVGRVMLRQDAPAFSVGATLGADGTAKRVKRWQYDRRDTSLLLRGLDSDSACLVDLVVPSVDVGKLPKSWNACLDTREFLDAFEKLDVREGHSVMITIAGGVLHAVQTDKSDRVVSSCKFSGALSFWRGTHGWPSSFRPSLGAHWIAAGGDVQDVLDEARRIGAKFLRFLPDSGLLCVGVTTEQAEYEHELRRGGAGASVGSSCHRSCSCNRSRNETISDRFSFESLRGIGHALGVVGTAIIRTAQNHSLQVDFAETPLLGIQNRFQLAPVP